MLFPTIDFAIFFAVVFTANWLLNPYPGLWKLAMIAASYVFYSWWDWRFVFLLAAVTVTAHVGGTVVHHFEDERPRRVAMIVSVSALLGILGWFKYYGFVAVNVDNFFHALGAGRVVPLLQVTLPVGVSFFTFMALSYVIDVYRRQLEPARAVDLAVYLSFFPHLIAGPIVRGEELLPQIRRKRDPGAIDFGRAAWLVAGGLFKKVVISSYIDSAIVTPVFSAPHQHSALEILFAAYGFAVQIYADFSGYTDIAIGLAMFLGFRFPDNFDAPYTARNLQDFWRRWHMTLSRWLRDYLYIPLGGGRGSRLVRGPQHHDHDGPRRPLARRGVDLRGLGAIHGTGQVVGHFRRSDRIAAGLDPVPDGRVRVWVATARHLPHRVPGLDLLPRRLDLDRAHHDRPALHGLGPRPAGDAAGGDHGRGRRRVAVPAARARGPGPARARPSTLGGARGHTGGRPSRHHDAWATRCRTVHLLQVLRPVPEGSAFGFRGSGGRFRACTCTRGPHDRHSR